MTEVRISWLRPDLNDTHVPAEGSVDFRPTTRYQQGEAVVVDASRTTTVDGDATVTLAPTGPGWCWRVTHRPSLGRSWSEYVLVPDSDDVVEFMDLVRVDPESLEPDADPDPAWWGAVDEMIIGAEVAGDDLQLTRQNGDTFEAGNVRGPEGPRGQQGAPGVDGATIVDDATAQAAREYRDQAQAVLEATESLGIRVDTSVGTRVYVGDTMIHGDTGWRNVSDLLINGWDRHTDSDET